MKKPRPSKRARTAEKFILIGVGGRISVKSALEIISAELRKKPTFRLPLDVGGDPNLSKAMVYEYLKNRLITFSQDSNILVETAQGARSSYIGEAEQEENCYLSAKAIESIASDLGLVLTVGVAESSTDLLTLLSPGLDNLQDVTSYGLLTNLPLKKVTKQPPNTKQPVDIDRKVYELRRLQKNLGPSPDSDCWDLDDDSEYEPIIDRKKAQIYSLIRRLSQHIPGEVPSKWNCRLAVALGWRAYLETNQRPDAKDVLRRMHELAERDDSHECLLEPILLNGGQKTVTYQVGKERVTYKTDACSRILNKWWDSYTKI